MLTNFYDPKNICSFFRQWIMHFFVLTISNHRLSLSNESSKTINPFIPEISLPAREEPDQLLPKREKKKKRVIARCRFLESIFGTHWLIVQYRIFSPRQGSIEWILLFRSISPSRSLHTLLFFPRKQPILTDPRFHHYFPSRFLIIVLFLREIESSPISSQLRQLLIYPTGNRSFCRNGFHPPSIFVSFRLIDLSLRIFVSPVRCRSPGREAGGGRRGLWARIDKRSTLFRFLSRFTR